MDWNVLDWRGYGAGAIRICAMANALEGAGGQGTFGCFGDAKTPEIILMQTGTQVRVAVTEQVSVPLLEQLSAYLRLHGVHKITTYQKVLAAYLAAAYPLCTQAHLMRYVGTGAAAVKSGVGEIYQPDSLLPIYDLLCAAMPDFAQRTTPEGWLVDFSHRRRHGWAQCWVYVVGGEMVSTAAITYRHYGGAVVGNVATLPAHGGKGYASTLLAHLCVYAKTQGLELFLSTHSPEFYKPLGWESCGTAYSLTKSHH